MARKVQAGFSGSTRHLRRRIRNIIRQIRILGGNSGTGIGHLAGEFVYAPLGSDLSRLREVGGPGVEG